jgi:hypothetical protein
MRLGHKKFDLRKEVVTQIICSNYPVSRVLIS